MAASLGKQNCDSFSAFFFPITYRSVAQMKVVNRDHVPASSRNHRILREIIQESRTSSNIDRIQINLLDLTERFVYVEYFIRCSQTSKVRTIHRNNEEATKKNMDLNITSFEIIRLWIFNCEPVTARKKLYCTFICYLSSKLLDKIKHNKHHADSTRLCRCDAVITKEWMYFVTLSLRHVCKHSAIHHIPQSAFTLK